MDDLTKALNDLRQEINRLNTYLSPTARGAAASGAGGSGTPPVYPDAFQRKINALNGGADWGTPSANGSDSGLNITIHAANVTIIAQNGVSGADGGGGVPGLDPYMQSGGGGGGGGGGKPGVSPSAGQAQKWTRFVQNMIFNPSPGTVVGSHVESMLEAGGMDALPGAMAVLAGYQVLQSGSDAAVGYMRATMGMESQLQKMEYGGTYVSPSLRAQYGRLAQAQGSQAAFEGAFGMLGKIPIVGAIPYNIVDQDYARNVARQEGSVEYAQMRQHANAWGYDLPNSPSPFTFGFWDRMGDEFHDFIHPFELFSGHGRTERDIKRRNDTDAAIRKTRPYAQGTDAARAALRGLGGARATSIADDARVHRAVDANYTPDEISQAYGDIMQMGASLNYGPLHAEMMMGHGDGTIQGAINALVSQGNPFAIRGLGPAGATEAQMAAGVAAAENVYQMNRRITFGQADISVAQSNLSTIFGNGSNASTRIGAIRNERGYLQSQIERLRDKQQVLRANGADAEAAQLEVEIQNMRSQVNVMPRLATEQIIGEKTGFIGAAHTAADTNVAGAMAGGSEADVRNAYTQSQTYAGQNAAFYARIAKLPDLRPEERRQYQEMARQEQLRHDKLIPQEMERFSLGVRFGMAGVAGAYAEKDITLANLFGGARERYDAMQERVGTIRANIAYQSDVVANPQKYGHNAQQQQEDQQKLIDLQRQEIEVKEQAIRSFYALNTAVEQTKSSIASIQANTSFMRGGGGSGEGGIGMSAQSLSAAKGARDTANQELAYYQNLVDTGQMPKNDIYYKAKEKAEMANQQVVGSENAMASTPFSAETRMRASGAQFGMQFLSMMPMGYGGMRQFAQSSMQSASEQIGELKKMAQETAAQNPDGKLTPAQQEIFQHRMQDAALQYGQAFQQLSYGWEARLTSTMINTPGNFAFVSPLATYRAAVGAGIRNPHFGATMKDVLSYAAGSGFADIAGATGTPAGMARTALSGMGGFDVVGIQGLPSFSSLGVLGPGGPSVAGGTGGQGGQGGTDTPHDIIRITGSGKDLHSEVIPGARQAANTPNGPSAFRSDGKATPVTIEGGNLNITIDIPGYGTIQTTGRLNRGVEPAQPYQEQQRNQGQQR